MAVVKKVGRGRPVKSDVRQHMVDMLSVMGTAYGYEIYKHYKEIYPRVTIRLIYYHLKKGIALGLFKKGAIKAEKGNYSWGPEAEKIYYELGPQAKPKKDPQVEQYFAKREK